MTPVLDPTRVLVVVTRTRFPTLLPGDFPMNDDLNDLNGGLGGVDRVIDAVDSLTSFWWG